MKCTMRVNFYFKKLLSSSERQGKIVYPGNKNKMLLFKERDCWESTEELSGIKNMKA